MKEVTIADFDAEVIKNETPVLVDVYADWCGPCKQLAPILDQIDTEVAGSAKVVKINADRDQELVRRLNVRALPTLLFFKNGEVVNQLVGAAHSKDKIKSTLLEA